MKKTWKNKLVACSAALVTLLAPFAAGSAVANAYDGDIPINKETFPCDAFQEYVKAKWDTDKNGILSVHERMTVGMIHFNLWTNEPEELTSFKGIEYAPNIGMIIARNGSLVSLDISKNPNLHTLDVTNNQIDALDISHNPNLREIHIGHNNVKQLDVKNHKYLEKLNAGDNELSSIDVTQNAELDTLDVARNHIASVDVTNNKKLWSLDVSGNGLSDVDVQQNKELGRLYASDNNLTSLDLSQNEELLALQVSNNQLPNIDLSNNQKIDQFDVSHNRLNYVRLTHERDMRGDIPYLFNVEVHDNPLLGADIEGRLIGFDTRAQDEQQQTYVTKERSLDLLQINKYLTTKKITKIEGGTIKNGVIVPNTYPGTVKYDYYAGHLDSDWGVTWKTTVRFEK
ncbi:leucine-rich repeat domain-containing protein [Bifidobacterium dolichotidis]|uniref:leucine-rich repeat domain-containing protein n=1 Tax=Bifidobacterium dolichotidis TaxID=2306976 RepID=UPI000F7E95A9|nr:hypothetical protein [Bifidobacterium dolichotidis]